MSLCPPTQNFICGHIQELRRCIYPTEDVREGDGIQLNETQAEILHVPSYCLSCVCYFVLEALLGGAQAVPQRYLVDIKAHVRLLSASASVSKQIQEELYSLIKMVKSADDVNEVRRGVIALNGFVYVSAWFGFSL